MCALVCGICIQVEVRVEVLGQEEATLEVATKGLTTVAGLGMLLHQAVPGFERWFGRRPEVDEATPAAIWR